MYRCRCSMSHRSNHSCTEWTRKKKRKIIKTVYNETKSGKCARARRKKDHMLSLVGDFHIKVIFRFFLSHYFPSYSSINIIIMNTIITAMILCVCIFFLLIQNFQLHSTLNLFMFDKFIDLWSSDYIIDVIIMIIPFDDDDDVWLIV